MKRHLICIIGLFLVGISGFDSRDVDAQHVNVPQAYQHPRLFFASEDIPQLRQQATTTHAHIWQPIREFADAALVQAQHIGQIRQLSCNNPDEGPNQFGDSLIPLAFSYIISGDLSYANAVKAALDCLI